MEAKKRKLASISPTSGLSAASSSHYPEISSQVTRADLKSEDEKMRIEALQILKKQLVSKPAVRAFVEPAAPPGIFIVVVELFVKNAMELEKNGTFPPELKFLIGILANCCYHSTLACLEMKQPHVRLNQIAVKIAESPLCTTECKYSLIRLLANISGHKEAALTLSTSSQLMEQIGKFLESEHPPTVMQALRCVQKLVHASFFRAVLVANIGFNLGKLVATKNGKVVEDSVGLLLTMSKRYAKEVGSQVASSDCAEKLLELFFGGNEAAQNLVVCLCTVSLDVRDKFGEKGAIQKIADEKAYHTEACCFFLSTFAQDAWGRASLRVSGALDVMITRFASPGCSDREKMTLIQAMKHFIHDTMGMAHLASTRSFVNRVIKDVEIFLAEHGTHCKVVICQDYPIRADSPLLMEIESHMRKRLHEREEPAKLHKDFSSLWGYSPSPRSLGSDNLSPPSSGAGSPVYAHMGSPGSSAASSRQRTDSPIDSDGLSGFSECSHVVRNIVDSMLWLISWQTQQDCNLPHLIRVDLVEAILNYLTLASRPDYRVARALRRIADFRIGLDKLLDMEFHIRVLNKLCFSLCRVTRNATRCIRCEKNYTFGKEILKEFSLHVDSDFGRSFVSQRLNSPDEHVRIKAAIAQVALKRHGSMEKRLPVRVKNSLDILFGSLQSYLEREDFEEIAEQPSYMNGPPYCSQIVEAFSLLVPLSRIRKMFDVDATYQPIETVRCQVSEEEPSPEKIDQYLKFAEDDNVLAYVRLEDACANSGYFQGMFSADMAEKTSKQRTFKFDPVTENCSSDDFTRFLHWLAGCRDKCTTVPTAASCLAMIELSDRYLCPSLAEWICSPHGPTSILINGNSLHFLFPAALTMNMHPRFLSSCFATLMRYASPENIVQTLIAIHRLPVLHESFLSKLRIFLTEPNV